jgi:hypothetical protein
MMMVMMMVMITTTMNAQMHLWQARNLPLLTTCCIPQAEEAAKKKEKGAKEKSASPVEANKSGVTSASTKSKVRTASASPDAACLECASIKRAPDRD